jgi:outer membrane lipoprotein-sorting protein
MKAVFASCAGGMCAAILLSVSMTCFAAPQAREQAGFTLDALMKSLAQRKHGEVSYEETDYLAVLDRPLKSSGVLIYDAPDHLEKRTLKPKEQSLTLDGDRMTVQRGRRRYQMQVSAYPKLAPLVDAMRDTLAGNEAALEKVFEVGFTGTADEWKLELVPRDKEIARNVKSVEIQGEHDEIRSVEILQVSGDRSVMTLGQPADTAGAGR